MLQMTNPVMVDVDTAQEGSPLELFHWAVGIVRRQFFVLASVALLVTSLGALYAFTASPTYTAEATILIDPRRVQLFPRAPFSENQIDSPTMESQVELLKSERVALSVIKKLRLTDDREFLASNNGWARVLELVTWSSARLWESTPLSEDEATGVALAVLSRNLGVARTGMSHILAIKYRASDPDRAAQIANAVAEAYIADQLQAKYDSTRSTSAWLHERIEELNKKRALADQSLVDFKKQNSIVAADGKLLNEQQITELSVQLTRAHQSTLEAKARLDRIDGVVRDGVLDSKTNATVADTLNNPIITQLRTRYLELVNREANWSQKYGAKHLAVVDLRNQIRDLRASALEELKRLRESYLSTYEIAQQQERDLEKGLADAIARSQTTDQAQVDMRALESSSQAYRSMHENFLQRYTETLQQQSFPYSEARIISPASPPAEQEWAEDGLDSRYRSVCWTWAGRGVRNAPGTAERFCLYQCTG